MTVPLRCSADLPLAAAFEVWTDAAVAVPVDIGRSGVAPFDAAPKVLVSEASC